MRTAAVRSSALDRGVSRAEGTSDRPIGETEVASEDLKRLVAREIASGESIAEVARRHKYSWKGAKKLVETPEVGG